MQWWFICHSKLPNISFQIIFLLNIYVYIIKPVWSGNNKKKSLRGFPKGSLNKLIQKK
jgi:hypothetical protein